ncbi:hypothetical protein TD95_002889 [Thielaviopsis punctulata]|uniref:sn-1-specific diacylglycerol lipase n=1 Tax=Thielaviopsis punctulata TaxID=72032 RepID=A0A0F4ZE62_9PEZI|nr:hypothetical protein TD95_002889 [Thielaviopsis punctulata]
MSENQLLQPPPPSPAPATAAQPTLLPSPLALAVSAATQTTGTLIRASSSLTTWTMHAACATTVSSLGFGLSFVESALCFAGRDLQRSSAYPRAAAAHVEPVVEGSLDALYRGMTCAVFLVAAGTRLSTAAVETSAQSSLVALTLLNQFFGSTDSSRAVAAIVALIRREFRNPATGAAEEAIGVKELLVALAAFAYLQNTCARSSAAGAPRVEEIVWDVVVLDDGARIDVHDVHEQSLAGPHSAANYARRPPSTSASELPRTSPHARPESAADSALHEHLLRQLPQGARVTVSTNTVTTRTITVDVPRTAGLTLTPPPGAELVQQASMAGPGSEMRRVVYRMHQSEASSATTERVEEEKEEEEEEEEDYASMENELEPRALAHAEVPAVRPITEVLSRPGTAGEQRSTLVGSRRGSAEGVGLGSPVALKPLVSLAEPVVSLAEAVPSKRQGELQSPVSPSKISRLSFLRTKEKDDKKDKKEKRTSFRSALKLAAQPAAALFSPTSPKDYRDKDSSDKGARDKERDHARSKSLNISNPNSISGLSRSRSHGHAKLVKKRRPPGVGSSSENANTGDRLVAGASIKDTDKDKHGEKNQKNGEDAEEQEKEKPVGPTPPVPRTPSSAVALRPKSSLSPNSQSTAHHRSRSLGSHASLSPNSHSLTPSPALRRSHLLLNPSLYSLNTSVPSHSLSSLPLLPASAYHQRSAYNPATLTALRRTGCIDPSFPRFPMLRNVTRYILFSSAAYGAHFLRYLGLSTTTDAHRPRFPSATAAPLTHRDIRAFAAHTGLSPDAVLLASFVDASGGSTSDGTAGAGSRVPLVHYIALDHASHAVVLACRGTLGFEDVLADLSCDYADMPWRSRSFRVHKGIHASARRILYGEDGRVLALLKAALDAHPTYGLVLTGHSLGGAVTALLGVMLAEPDPHALGFVTAAAHPDDPHAALRPPAGRPIHVYAYGAPSTMCRRLQKATRGLITSVVHGCDVVPYLSLGVLHDFQALAAAFKTEGGAARAALAKYVSDQVQSEVLSRWYGSAGTYKPPAEDRVVPGGKAGWAEDLLGTLRAAMQSDKLVPPGEVFVVESTSVLRRDVGVADSGLLGAPAKRIVLRYVSDVAGRFKEMRFRPSMLIDHSPSRYEETLNRLRVGVEQVWM